MNSKLFTPISLRGLTLKNRIVVSPMCQYSALEGSATDWHLIHLGHLSLGGASLLIIEATAVEPKGRISSADLGLYSDDNEAALARVLKACRAYGNTAIGIQLSHSGRKGSAKIQWTGNGSLDKAAGGWQPLAPSALPFDDGWTTPHAMSLDEIAALKGSFIATTRRAARLGLDLIEIHAAHGYLLHEFASPLSNQRTDRYGGSLENRMRLPLEIAAAIREVWPAERPLGARITGSDWVKGGWTPDDAVVFATRLKEIGLDYVCVSSGGVAAKASIPLGPGYQVPFSARVRSEVGIPTQTVGLIADPHQAEAIVASGKADMVALARGFLDDPRWAWHAAEALGAETAYPPQYLRVRPSVWPGAQIARPPEETAPAKAS